MIDFSPLVGISGGTSLLLLVAALALDFVLGLSGLGARLCAPARGGRFFLFLEQRLNRERRSEANRIIRGALVVLVALCGGIVLGVVFWRIAQGVPYGWVLEFLVLFFCIGQGRALDPLRRVGRELKASGVAAARKMLAGLWQGYDRDMDEYGYVRAAIEEGVLAFAAAVVAPVFWFVLLGLPGLVVYQTIHVMAGVWASRGARADAFAMTAERLDAALGFFPVRLSACLLLGAALFVPHTSLAKGVSVMMTDGRRRPGIAGGWPLGVAAGVLGLALGGPGSRYAAPGGGQWIGDGRARAGHGDLRYTLYLVALGCLIHAILVAGFLLFRLAG